jgi:hypothetical protein
MKSLTSSPKIKQDAELSWLVERANAQLERELGASADNVSADWTLREHGGRPLLSLEIRDWTGRVETTFAPDELKNPVQTSARLLRLWGDLLQLRSHQQLASLASEPSHLSGEEALDRINDAILDFTERQGSEPKRLKLPLRYASALLKLGYSFWGDLFPKIRETGIRAIDGKPLLGVSVVLVNGPDADLVVE